MSNLNDVGLEKPSQQGDKAGMEGDGLDTHFRVTLGHDRHPHRIVEVCASDRESAKAVAADNNPEWEVVQARVSKKQTRAEGA